jgi:DNA-binding NarL/FixJ family response regulator
VREELSEEDLKDLTGSFTVVIARRRQVIVRLLAMGLTVPQISHITRRPLDSVKTDIRRMRVATETTTMTAMVMFYLVHGVLTWEEVRKMHETFLLDVDTLTPWAS